MVWSDVFHTFPLSLMGNLKVFLSIIVSIVLREVTFHWWAASLVSYRKTLDWHEWIVGIEWNGFCDPAPSNQPTDRPRDKPSDPEIDHITNVVSFLLGIKYHLKAPYLTTIGVTSSQQQQHHIQFTCLGYATGRKCQRYLIVDLFRNTLQLRQWPPFPPLVIVLDKIWMRILFMSDVISLLVSCYRLMFQTMGRMKGYGRVNYWVVLLPNS